MNLRRHEPARQVLAALVLLFHCAAGAQGGQAGLADRIRALATEPAATLRSELYDDRDPVGRFYASRDYAPAWEPEQARQALELLRAAPADGLAPEDYGTDALLRQAQGPQDRARFDVDLTRSMLRYLNELHVGRVRSEFHPRLPDPRLQQFDPVERLQAALDQGQLGQLVTAAAPRFPIYAPVKRRLAHYRELAQQPQRRLAALPGRMLAPGSPYAGAAALRARLVLLGDLAADAAPPQRVYSDQLAEGVRRFQARHGLQEDGVLGRATIAALQVPLARRVRQLELTLERLRWLPDLPPGRVIAVNLPAYRLWAFDTAAAEPGAVLEMRVIVGEAIKTPTPLFIGQMRYLEFHPYWNVPRSITLKEIIPKLERSPAWLVQNDMELVPVGSGQITQAVTSSTLAALRDGKYRVRQRPGPDNALGAVKFILPNSMAIYLHATPEHALFARPRRDLSHGCIRVEQPVELAQFVLGDQPQWSLADIGAAMAPGSTLRVDLPAEVPVVLFYATAITGRDGTTLFAPDVYGRDALLEQALAARAAKPKSEIVPASSAPKE
jgi:murein L,D-transpeptidase YcbB/YkuD